MIMKKILYAAVVAAIAMSSCSKEGVKNGEANDESEKEKTESAGKVDPSDTTAVDYGRMTGTFIGNELAQYAEQTGKPYNKEEFIAGVEYILNSQSTEAFLAGMSAGLQMVAELNRFADAGYPLSRPTVIANFKASVAQPLDDSELSVSSSRIQKFAEKMERERNEKAAQEKAQSPEAIQNIKTGEALVAKAIKDEPNAKTMPSGLVYVVSQKGDGGKINPDDDVQVKYVGSHLDGKVFDSGTATFKPSHTVSGFNEGLTLLSKGAKARLYIPGKLGYGPNGSPGAGIGPMETLVFDVEILDVTPASN